MAGSSTWETPSPRTRRRYRRWDTNLPIKAEIGGQEHYCSIGDISPLGATVRLVVPQPVSRGTTIELFFRDFGRVRGQLRWSAHEVLGIKFALDRAARDEFSDWLLRSGMPRRRQRHDCHIEATAVMADGEASCVVTNISESGAGVRFTEQDRAAVGRDLVLLLPDHAPVEATIRHVTQGTTGLSFLAAPRRMTAA